MAKSTRPQPDSDGFAGQDEVLLGVLSAVERDSQISQRTLSRELNVALGLANAYIKRCVRKGWVKVQQIPRRRYAYYLTPQGFAEKSRLAGEYFSSSFTYFRRARAQMSELMDECAKTGRRRIAFAGVSDLAEVGVICAHDFPIEVVAIVEPSYEKERFCGLPVKPSVAGCGEVDAVIVTSLEAPSKVYGEMCAAMGVERVLTPAILRLALPKSPDFMGSQRAAE